VGFGVVGLEHLHVFELVDGLCAAGAVPIAHTAGDSLSDAYGAWQTDSVATDAAGVLADDRVQLVVLAGVPSTRADAAVAALDAGRSVLSDKPGATTSDQLERVRAAVAQSAGRWWVLFSERFGVPAVRVATTLARDGAIGEVVHVSGSAPHRGALDQRPEWFFDPGRAGALLVDLGAHQVDQFLASTGAETADVVGAASGNVAAPDHPAFHDIAEVTLAAGDARGHHRVDYLEADGFPAWGDVRLVITGTAGRLEVRTPVVDGVAGAPELWCTDHDGHRRVDVDPTVTWPRELLDDLADGGERLMSREHPFAVTTVCLSAAAGATPWTS
jgi:predicted dehydrogenase